MLGWTKRLDKEKQSSLFDVLVSDKEAKYNPVFVLGESFQQSLVFASKSGSEWNNFQLYGRLFTLLANFRQRGLPWTNTIITHKEAEEARLLCPWQTL
jgi:hypothetical protein